MSVDLHDGNEAERLCDFCEEPSRVLTKRIDSYMGYLGMECPMCADREPGDSHYEDHGTVRHELQDASGVWRR